jgi:hypothetical protein
MRTRTVRQQRDPVLGVLLLGGCAIPPLRHELHAIGDNWHYVRKDETRDRAIPTTIVTRQYLHKGDALCLRVDIQLQFRHADCQWFGHEPLRLFAIAIAATHTVQWRH